MSSYAKIEIYESMDDFLNGSKLLAGFKTVDTVEMFNLCLKMFEGSKRYEFNFRRDIRDIPKHVVRWPASLSVVTSRSHEFIKTKEYDDIRFKIDLEGLNKWLEALDKRFGSKEMVAVLECNYEALLWTKFVESDLSIKHLISKGD